MRRKSEFRTGAVKMEKKPTLRNRCQCRLCLDVIESTFRHDFVRCKCGAIFTDGGPFYVRRGTMKPGTTFEDIIDIGDDDAKIRT
jgi:hypothetical protein